MQKYPVASYERTHVYLRNDNKTHEIAQDLQAIATASSTAIMSKAASSRARSTIVFTAVNREDLKGLRKRGRNRRQRRKHEGGGKLDAQKRRERLQEQSSGLTVAKPTMSLSPVLSSSRRDKRFVQRQHRHQMAVEVSRLPKLALSDLEHTSVLTASSARSSSSEKTHTSMRALTEPAEVRSTRLDGPICPPTEIDLSSTGTYRFLGRSVPLIEATFRRAGLKPTTSSENWNILWSTVHPRPCDMGKLVAPPIGAGVASRRINIFPRSFELTRKDALSRNVNRMREVFSRRDFNFMPESYCLPSEREMLFQTTRRDRDSGRTRTWIVKPAASACGRGIYLTTKYENMPQVGELTGGSNGHSEYVVEEYIERPLLLRGFKFDLRIYVAVTSFSPLRIYLYEEGLVRCATEEYVAPADLRESLRQRRREDRQRATSSKRHHLTNHDHSEEKRNADEEYDAAESLLLSHRFMHLTNYSVNKKNKAHFKPAHVTATDTYDHSPQQRREAAKFSIDRLEVENDQIEDNKDEGEEEEEEEEEEYFSNRKSNSRGQLNSKMTLAQLWRELLEMGVDPDTVWERIKAVVIKTLLAVEPQIAGALEMYVPGRNCCFQVYGFDVLIDEELKVWLLEVNFSPSMNTDSNLDLHVKGHMLADLLNLVGIFGQASSLSVAANATSRNNFQREHTQPPLSLNSMPSPAMYPAGATADAFEASNSFGLSSQLPHSPVSSKTKPTQQSSSKIDGGTSQCQPPLSRLETHVISDYSKEVSRARQQEALGPGRGFRAIFPLASNAWEFQRFFLDGARAADACLAEFVAPKEGRYRHIQAQQIHHPQARPSPPLGSPCTKLSSGAVWATHHYRVRRQRQQQQETQQQSHFQRSQRPGREEKATTILESPTHGISCDVSGSSRGASDWFAEQRAQVMLRQQYQQSPEHASSEMGTPQDGTRWGMPTKNVPLSDKVADVRQRVLQRRKELREIDHSASW